MSKQTTFATTEAGHRFLELYAEPVVTNTYLKITILVLAVVALALLALLYRAQTAALRLKPLVISVNDIGRGQVMNYDDFAKVPVERVGKYYLARWVELYYGRNHATLHRDFSESLNFFSNQLQSATLAEVNKAKTLDTFLLDPSAPNVDIEIKAVVLEDTRQAPVPRARGIRKGLPLARRPAGATPRALDGECRLRLPRRSAQPNAPDQSSRPCHQLRPRRPGLRELTP